MISDLARSFAMNMEYAHRLLSDVPDQSWAAQPIERMNHAAWITGHLAYSFDSIGEEMGLARALPPSWKELFGTGTCPSANLKDYPARPELIQAMNQGRDRILKALGTTTDHDLCQALPDPRYRHIFPTLGSAMLHILTVHTAVHLGQLSAWRRAMALPPVPDPQ